MIKQRLKARKDICLYVSQIDLRSAYLRCRKTVNGIMNTPSIDPFMGLEFEKSYSDIFDTEIDFQGFSLPHTPTRPSFSPKELVKGEEKSKNAKFPSVEHPIDKPMPVLIDSRTIPQDEVKIAESLNYQHPVGNVSKCAADQVLASRSEERAEPSTNESISCNKFDKDKPSEGRMKHAKVKLSAISTTEPSEPLFIPYLPENNDIKLAKIKKSIRELKVFGNIRNRKNTGKAKTEKNDCRYPILLQKTIYLNAESLISKCTSSYIDNNITKNY